jgi:hypothetical protein
MDDGWWVGGDDGNDRIMGVRASHYELSALRPRWYLYAVAFDSTQITLAIGRNLADCFAFMSRKSIEEVPAVKQTRSLLSHRISLTPARTEQAQSPVSVLVSEMIAYSQGSDFTRLNLTGGKVLDVKETTDVIDRLVRAAAAQSNLLPGEITLSD